MSDEIKANAPTKDRVKTCALCSHMRTLNKGTVAECEMKAKGMHPGQKFKRMPNGEFETFAWLKARDCEHYDGDEEDQPEE